MVIISMTLIALSPLIAQNPLGAFLLLGLALVVAYSYCRYKFQYFERQGLRNPKPWPVVGNLLASSLKNRVLYERQWPRKYGKLYGIFQGFKPCYVVADADLLRQICIKDFDAFPNHEFMDLLNKYERLFLFLSQDDQWKRSRALQSPTFTSGKIKRMYKLLQKCATDLADCFGEQLDDAESKLDSAARTGDEVKTVVQLKDIYGLYTMDGIASCGYGLKMERQRGAIDLKAVAMRNEFVSLAMGLFSKFRLPRMLMIFSLPTWLLKLLGVNLTPASVFDPFAAKVRSIIESRRASGKKFDDYLQLLLDAKLDVKLELDQLDARENHHAGLTHDSILDDRSKMIRDVEESGKSSSSRARLTDDDILASAMSLMAVGVETTSTLLTHCTYALAHFPDIQQKLYETLKSLAAAGSEAPDAFDYETLTSCDYLDAVISETMRALSPVLQIDRIAKRDYYVEKYDLTIPRGSKLLLAYYAIMNDSDYWQSPDQFQPDRFMPENRDKIYPGSYCPFGLGPRHCLGMRFSLTEAKVGLATVMMRYKFEPAPGTKFPPPAKIGIGMNNIATPQVLVVRR